jgi:hypothetical protein
LEVVKKRKQRHKDGYTGHTGRAAVANSGCLHSPFTLTVRSVMAA